jgi:hypothetical protein
LSLSLSSSSSSTSTSWSSSFAHVLHLSRDLRQRNRRHDRRPSEPAAAAARVDVKRIEV